MFQGEKEDLIGKHFIKLDIFSPKDIPKILSSFTKLIAGKNVTLTVDILTTQGTQRCLECSTRITQFGNTSYILVVARDITELRDVEKQIKYQADLIENVSDAIISTDLQFIIKSWNKAAECIYGWKAGEVLGKQVDDITKLEYPDDEVDDVKNKLFKEGHWKGEILQETKEGRILAILTSVSLITDDSGNPIGTVSVNRDISTLKKAYNELNESEKRLQDLTFCSGDWIWEVDKFGKYTFASGKVTEILGYTPEELMGKTPFDLMPEEEARRISEEFKKILAEKKPIFDLENWALTKNGERICLLTNGIPILDNDGELIGYRGVDKDITEHKRSIEMIKIQRDLAVQLSHVSDLEEGLYLCLDAAITISGMDSGGIYLIDPSSRSLDLIVHRGLSPEFIQCVSHYDVDSENMRLVLQSKQIYTQYENLGVPSGEIRQGEQLHAIGLVSFHNEGNVIGCINVASHTATEIPLFARKALESIAAQIGSTIVRLQAAKEIKGSKEKFQQLAELLPEIVFEMDAQGIITFVNKKSLEITGYTNEEYERGFQAMQLLISEDRPFAMENIMKVMKGQDVGPQEYTAQRKDGTQFPIIIYSSPIIKDNSIVGLRGIIIDITERKKAETEMKHAQDALQKLNRELEHKVQDRTAEIQKILQHKDEFVNQLGHDLKNPLNPLLNLLPLLERDEQDPERRTMFDVILRNVNYMKNLVVKTIEFARLNSPNTTFNMANTNLRDEVNHVIDKNTILFEEHNIEIINRIPNTVQVHVDQLRFEELVDNLLSNAVKYSNDQGKISIDATQNDTCITVSVQDTGIGMTTEQLERVFDEFFKADPSRHDFDSSGLGMSICKRIVEKHGGNIWAESPGLGQGSTFYFTLPKVIL